MSEHKTRKDRRKSLTGAKSKDSRCRNRGSCSSCLLQRTISSKKREQLIIEIMKSDEELGLYQDKNKK